MSAPGAEGAVAARSVVADYVELCKPRLNSLVVVTTLGGAWLASGAVESPAVLIHAVVGAALAAVGSSAINQFMERGLDARMRRTASRPVPAGRIRPGDALAFGVLSAVGGVAWLAVATTAMAAVIAAATLFIYLFVYTPMKSRSSANTLVGAIPGALPPLIGWAAVAGRIDPPAWVLFAILYLWQIPHFLAIAWLYRADYERAGLVMLPGVDPEGWATGRQAILHSVGVLLASLFAMPFGLAGARYAVGATVLGLLLVAAAVRFRARRDDASARLLLRASLLYLPLLLTLMGLDRAPA